MSSRTSSTWTSSTHGSDSSEEHTTIGVHSCGKSLSWDTKLTVKVGLEAPIFRPRSDSVRGPEGCDSPRSPGILRRERSCPEGGGSDKQRADWQKEQEVLHGPVAVRIREARLARMLDRQVRETEMTRPLAIEVDITLTNAWDAMVDPPLETILVSPLLDLVGKLQIYNDDLRYIGE